MKKIIKIVAALTAFALIGIILWFANGLVGNPISYMIANNAAEKYIPMTYPNIELNTEKATYSFKTGYYYVQVRSPISIDTYFTLVMTPFGEIRMDTYENDVINKNNTYLRIDDEYRKIVDSVLESDSFPYKVDMVYGTIPHIGDEEILEESEAEKTKNNPKLKDLVIDKVYDIQEVGKKWGNIVLYVEDDDVSAARASEILLHTKEILDKENVRFFSINFVLSKTSTEEDPYPDYPQFDVREFLYKDIYTENLEKRMIEAAAALDEYYKKEDAKKNNFEKFIE